MLSRAQFFFPKFYFAYAPRKVGPNDVVIEEKLQAKKYGMKRHLYDNIYGIKQHIPEGMYRYGIT